MGFRVFRVGFRSGWGSGCSGWVPGVPGGVPAFTDTRFIIHCIFITLLTNNDLCAKTSSENDLKYHKSNIKKY